MCNLFFGKNRRRLKLLFYDGTGLVLIAKRIKRGGSSMSLEELLGRNEITQDELKLIFHGSVIRRPNVDRSMPIKVATTRREPFALLVRKILAHLGLPTKPPVILAARSRGPPANQTDDGYAQASLDFPVEDQSQASSFDFD